MVMNSHKLANMTDLWFHTLHIKLIKAKSLIKYLPKVFSRAKELQMSLGGFNKTTNFGILIGREFAP